MNEDEPLYNINQHNGGGEWIWRAELRESPYAGKENTCDVFPSDDSESWATVTTVG